ncbi:hypothetical protein KQX54_000822, partial [Cotesia glomerata]
MANNRRTFRLDRSAVDEDVPQHHQALAKELFDALPYFNGEGSDALAKFELFEGIVRNWLPSIPVERQDHFARRVAQKLYGRAKRLVEHVELTSVEDILLTLAKKLKRGDPYINWQKKLASAVPKESENIEDFYFRLSDMIRYIELNAPEDDREVVKRTFEKTAATTLYEYLPDYLRCLCKIRKAETLDRMYAAIESDAHRKPNRRRTVDEDAPVVGEAFPPALEYYRRPGPPGLEGNRHYPQMPRPSWEYDDRGNYRDHQRTLVYQDTSSFAVTPTHDSYFTPTDQEMYYDFIEGHSGPHQGSAFTFGATEPRYSYQYNNHPLRSYSRPPINNRYHPGVLGPTRKTVHYADDEDSEEAK